MNAKDLLKATSAGNFNAVSTVEKKMPWKMKQLDFKHASVISCCMIWYSGVDDDHDKIVLVGITG